MPDSAEGDSAFLAGGGELGSLMRAHGWSDSPIGGPQTWPQPLKTLVAVMLAANQPMFIAWGPERTLLYNDAYAEILAGKHPSALGCDFLEVWGEIRNDLTPIVEEAYAGRSVHMDDIELLMQRRGFPEEAHFAFSYTPVADETGAVAGFFCPCREITGQVFSQRRQAFRLALEQRLRAAGDPGAIMQAAVAMLGENLAADRVGYGQVQPDGTTVRLSHCYANGVEPLLGDFRLDVFGPDNIARQRAGATEVCDDVNLDPDQDPAFWAPIGTRAFVSVPLVRDGKLRATLYVNTREPRRWSAEDVSLIEEVAARTWDAVDRLRAETELGESDARYRTLFDAIDSGFCVVEVDLDAAGGRIDYRVVEANPAFYAHTGSRGISWATGCGRPRRTSRNTGTRPMAASRAPARRSGLSRARRSSAAGSTSMPFA